MYLYAELKAQSPLDPPFLLAQRVFKWDLIESTDDDFDGSAHVALGKMTVYFIFSIKHFADPGLNINYGATLRLKAESYYV